MGETTQEDHSSADQQRLKVLESAFASFNYAGYHNVSTDDIARSLHMSKKTLYKLFRSKEEILDAAIAYQFDLVDRQLQQGLAGSTTPKAGIWFIAEQYVALLSLISPQLSQEIRTDVPYVDERIHRFQREHFHKTLVKLFKGWRDAGLIEYPSPTKAVVAAFFRALDGQVETLPETLKFICGAFVKGMSVKDKDREKDKEKVREKKK